MEETKYISSEERFSISSETGRIYDFVREVEEYNRLNGTRLSYGQYESMLNCIKEKREKEIRAKIALKIGAIMQSQGVTPKEVEKAYDSLDKRGKKK